MRKLAYKNCICIFNLLIITILFNLLLFNYICIYPFVYLLFFLKQILNICIFLYFNF